MLNIIAHIVAMNESLDGKPESEIIAAIRQFRNEWEKMPVRGEEAEPM